MKGSPHATAAPLNAPNKTPPIRKSPIADPRFYPAPEPNQTLPDGTPRKQKTKHLSNPPIEPHIGWLIDSRDHATQSESFNERLSMPAALSSNASTSLGSTPQSLPKFEHPSHSLLKENGFTQLVYKKYWLRCIKERKRLGNLSSAPYQLELNLRFLQELDKVKK